MNDHELFDLLAQIVDTPSVQASIEQITAFAAQTFDTPHVGVTLIKSKGRHFDTAGPTNDTVRDVDQLQNTLHEGPCIDAATHSRTVISNDLDADPRWPAWGPRAAALGMGSVLSSEIHAGDRRVGALNIYGVIDRDFDRSDLETAQVLASHAAIALRFTEQLEGLRIALDNRTTIGQAQGILMNRFNLDADRAFSTMRRLSQHQNIRLIEIAQQIVDGPMTVTEDP